jgi:hypothetical protein
MATSISFCTARAHVTGLAPQVSVANSASVPSTLAPGPEQAFAAQMRTKGLAPPRWFVLSAHTKSRFQGLFSRFGLDLGKLAFSIGGAFGQAGLTLGDTIFLETGFPNRSHAHQLGLLSHEITHSIQYRKLGWGAFLLRYRREWKASGGDPYMRPGDPKWELLKSLHYATIDPVDPRFYLDSLCDRMRVAAETGR